MSTDNLVTLKSDANPNQIHELKPYKSLETEELQQRIEAVRKELGDSLLILGHHYQQDEVIAPCALRGDSYKLSQMAADTDDSNTTVLCGGHYMPETS
ncbi:MAG: quinolinate synthase NadA, partial [Rubripirellula sp.]